MASIAPSNGMSSRLVSERLVTTPRDPGLAGRVTLLRNAALSTSVQYVESMVGIATGVLIARALGPTDYGHYAFAVWLCGWMLFAANNGINISAIRFVAEFRGSRQQSIAEALGATFLRWQTVCTIVILAVFVLVAMVKPPEDWLATLPWMIGLSVLAVAARARFWLLSAIAKGFERYEPENYSILGMVAVNLVAIGFWWYFDRSVVGAFAIYALTGVLCYLLSQRLFKSCDIQLRPSAIPAETRARVVSTVISSGVLVGIGLLSGRALEIGLLKAYWSAEAIAYFVIAGTLTKGAVDLFTTGLATVLLPVMSRAFGRSGTTRVGEMMAESIRYYWFIGLLIAGFGVVVTAGAVSLLYGANFTAAIPAITYSLVIAGLCAPTGALGAFQTASDFQKDRIWTALATLAINIVSAFALVPGWGLNGAILSLAITKVASVGLQFLMVRRRIRVEIAWAMLFRLTLSALLACGLAVFIDMAIASRFSFVLTALVFVAAFVALSIVMRSWYGRDYELVAEVALRLGPIGSKLAAACRQIGRRFAI